MDGEILNFIFVWISAMASLCYCYTIGKIIPKGIQRLLLILPVILLFLLLPLNLHTINLGAPSAFFLSWLANFKLLIFAFDKGPLSSPSLSYLTFTAVACLPIKIQPEKTYPAAGIIKTLGQSQKSNLACLIKALIFSSFVPVYSHKQEIHPWILMFLYGNYVYISLEIMLAVAAAVARALLGAELEPQFNDPYFATSLQDFWGRRWNLMVSNVMRPTVYHPVCSVFSRWIGKKWAPMPGVIASFFVSGMMHELVFYYMGREKPTWELTCFFLLHGVCMVVEVSLKRTLKGRLELPPWVSGPLTVAFVVVTGLWLFMPPLLRCQVDVRSRGEYIAFFEYLKNAKRHLNYVSPATRQDMNL